MDKEYIINSYSKLEFENFVANDNNGIIFELLDEEGINILKNSSLKEERIEYILAFSPYKQELLKYLPFLNLILNSDISRYYALLGNLSEDTYDFILKTSLELLKDTTSICRLLNYFDSNYVLKSLDKFNYSSDLIHKLLLSSDEKVCQKILDNYDIDLTNTNIYLPSLFEKCRNSVLQARAKKYEGLHEEGIHIPPRFITRELANKMWKNYDIFDLRQMINDAEYSTDVTALNEYVKASEDKLINNYKFINILSPFNELYMAFKNYKIEELKLNNNEENNYDEARIKYIRILNAIDNKFNDEIEEKYNENGIEEVESYFKLLSNNMISNYIIDYHFEECYYNIMLDMRELLNFCYDGNISITKDRIDLYCKISDIDSLSIDEKIELHNTLKTMNMKEVFYDDMRFARNVVSETIKNYSLTHEDLKQYRDEKLSNKYGVDVYNIGDSKFFGIVKTGTHNEDKLPVGHSYSIVGDKCLAVFGDVKASKTFLYDAYDLNPEQIVHVYPYDSFTYYHPFEYSKESTNRVNVLMVPDELVDTSKSYNELIVLEKGKTTTEIDERIPHLKKIALYCIDEIRNQDIEAAKGENVGIVLINSRNYVDEKDNIPGKYRHNITNFDYNYYNSYDKEQFEKAR